MNTVTTNEEHLVPSASHASLSSVDSTYVNTTTAVAVDAADEQSDASNSIPGEDNGDELPSTSVLDMTVDGVSSAAGLAYRRFSAGSSAMGGPMKRHRTMAESAAAEGGASSTFNSGSSMDLLAAAALASEEDIIMWTKQMESVRHAVRSSERIPKPSKKYSRTTMILHGPTVGHPHPPPPVHAPGEDEEGEGGAKLIAKKKKTWEKNVYFRLTGAHTPRTASLDERKRCMVCSRRRPRIYCIECQVGLCTQGVGKENCWHIFHNEEKFIER